MLKSKHLVFKKDHGRPVVLSVLPLGNPIKPQGEKLVSNQAQVAHAQCHRLILRCF